MNPQALAVSILANHIQSCTILVEDRTALQILCECAAALRELALDLQEKNTCHTPSLWLP
jgi:hypothetical protein